MPFFRLESFSSLICWMCVCAFKLGFFFFFNHHNSQVWTFLGGPDLLDFCFQLFFCIWHSFWLSCIQFMRFFKGNFHFLFKSMHHLYTVIFRVTVLCFSCVGMFRSCCCSIIGLWWYILPFLLLNVFLHWFDASGFGMTIDMDVDCIVFVGWVFCSFITWFLYCLLSLMAKVSSGWQVFRYSRVFSCVNYWYLVPWSSVFSYSPNWSVLCLCLWSLFFKRVWVVLVSM